MNVFSNSIPNKVIDFNDKDPSWMTLNLKDKLKDDLKKWKSNLQLSLAKSCNIRSISSNIKGEGWIPE